MIKSVGHHFQRFIIITMLLLKHGAIPSTSRRQLYILSEYADKFGFLQRAYPPNVCHNIAPVKVACQQVATQRPAPLPRALLCSEYMASYRHPVRTQQSIQIYTHTFRSLCTFTLVEGNCCKLIKSRISDDRFWLTVAGPGVNGFVGGK